MEAHRKDREEEKTCRISAVKKPEEQRLWRGGGLDGVKGMNTAVPVS